MGARLVTAAETEEGRRWSEARIKELTGGDKISARFMRQDFFRFLPAVQAAVLRQPHAHTAHGQQGNHAPGSSVFRSR